MQTNDLLWKGIIESLIEDFLAFFYPDEVGQIDFGAGVTFLDQELAQLFPDSGKDTRYIDKLVQVKLFGGTEQWILIHVEVQGYYDKSFAERMFKYYYLIRERYGKEVTSLAIFTDKNPKFKPNTYQKEFWGVRHTYSFKTYKVLEQEESVLENSPNPFAIVILATLIALKKREIDDEGIKEVKRNLIRLMLDRKYSKPQVRDLCYFINHYIRFANKKNTLIFAEEITTILHPNSVNMGIQELLLKEAEQNGISMGIEQGIEKGIEKGIIENAIRVILNLNSKGFPEEFISEVVQLPIEKVREVIKAHQI